jgi:hypothetical protein
MRLARFLIAGRFRDGRVLSLQPIGDPCRILSAIENGVDSDQIAIGPVVDGEGKALGEEAMVSVEVNRMNS